MAFLEKEKINLSWYAFCFRSFKGCVLYVHYWSLEKVMVGASGKQLGDPNLTYSSLLFQHQFQPAFLFMILRTKLKGFPLFFFTTKRNKKWPEQKKKTKKGEEKKDTSWSTVWTPACFHQFMGDKDRWVVNHGQNPSSPWHITVLLSAYIESVVGTKMHHIKTKTCSTRTVKPTFLHRKQSTTTWLNSVFN